VGQQWTTMCSRRLAGLGGAIGMAVISALLIVFPVTASAAAATLTIDSVGSHSLTTAHVSGEVEVPADGFETYWGFEYSDDGVTWSGFSYSGPVQPGEAATVEAELTGLKAETSYEVRLAALNFSDFVEEFSSTVSFETDPAVAPALVLDAPSSVSFTTAHISGSVDPEGGNEDSEAGLLPIVWEMQTNREAQGWGTARSGELSGSDAAATTPITVEADLTGLTPNAPYKFRLIARYAGLVAESSEGDFTTGALKPEIAIATLWEPKQTSIQLNALVNPHNSPLTDCRFEYGAGGTLDRTVPCEAQFSGNAYSAPTGEGFQPVAARLTGLAPGTQYEFRLVAVNATGVEEGPVQGFRTPAPSVPTCPNQAIRDQQHARHLPRCRAWEMVSPVDKNSLDITGNGENVVAAKAGDGVVYDAGGNFGDSVGSADKGHTGYLARRLATGWTTRAISPASSPEAPQTFLPRTSVPIFSDDLSRALVWAYDLPGVSGDVPKQKNIYIEETASRSLQPITTSPLFTFPDFFDERNLGASGDLRHFTFVTNKQLVPEAADGFPNVYTWDEGILSLTGVLPDGTVHPEGSIVTPEDYRGAMSVDGSRQIFSSPAFGNSQLYLRIDGQRTVWVSEPEGPDSPPEPEGVVFQSMTPDGQNIFFTTTSRLVGEDQNDGSDIYRYTDSDNPDSDGNLTLISRTGGAPQRAVIGTSDDGRVVYWQSGGGIYIWEGGEVRKLGEVPADTNPKFEWAATASRPGGARVSPDGRWLAFLTNQPSGVTDNLSIRYGPSGRLVEETVHSGVGIPAWELGRTTPRELYLFDALENTLACVSCPSGVGISHTTVMQQVSSNEPEEPRFVAHRSTFLGPQGHLFFSTVESLVPEDVNGVHDAYEYDPASGSVALLSSGRGRYPTTFAGAASDDGTDVFLLTRQRLTGSDPDELIDLYDARMNGGVLESSANSSGCSSGSCRAGASPSPAVPGIASQSVARGNRVAKPVRKRCRRAQGKKNHRPMRKGRCRKRKAGSKGQPSQPASADPRSSR
jgi:hypothetical protein